MQAAQRSTFLPLLLEATLSSKARSSDEFSAALEALRRRVSDDERALVEELLNIWTQLSALWQRGPAPGQSTADHGKAVQDLQTKQSDLEAKISARSADFRKLR